MTLDGGTARAVIARSLGAAATRVPVSYRAKERFPTLLDSGEAKPPTLGCR
jgi:shikimate 5-dehydrogenase